MPDGWFRRGLVGVVVVLGAFMLFLAQDGLLETVRVGLIAALAGVPLVSRRRPHPAPADMAPAG